ncbi:hypothetical protein [Lactococcus lactis]|uniref:hypothetical protein n=1 Tax=Lactococcus lactis TaxID=1358 RepID=UPI00129D98F0|nr:hypothetical protein [Lactococcus lactis]
MKKTIISVFSITSLVAVNLIALKFRLKPLKKEVFNFDEPLKEEEQEVLDEDKQSVEFQENKQQKYDTQNKIEEIQHQVELLNALQKKFPLNPDQFEKRIMDSYDASLRNALDFAIKAIDTTQLFIDHPLKKLTLDRPSTVLSSISANVKEITSHLSIYDFSYPLKKQYCIEDIIAELNCTLTFLQGAESEGMLLTSSSAEANQDDFNDKAFQNSDNQDLNSRKSVAKERVEASNIDELKEILSRSLYNAQSRTLELREIVKSSNHNILDEVDYQKEYIKLLNTLTNIVSRHQENDTLGSLLLVARYLHDPDYLSNWLKNAKKDERLTIIGNNEGEQQEFVEPNILKNISPEPIAAYDDVLSNHLKIEDIPQKYRSLDGYIRSFECARETSVDRYIEICRLLLEDIQSLTEKSAMTKKEGKRLLSDTVINGYDYFEDKEALDNFIIEQEEALGSTIGLFRDPNYSAEEFNKNVNNHSKDVIDLVYSAKEDLKTLSYIGRQIRNSQIWGIGFAIIVNSKYFKRPRKAYEYLVEHADEWRETPEVSDVVISDISVKISFERK